MRCFKLKCSKMNCFKTSTSSDDEDTEGASVARANRRRSRRAIFEEDPDAPEAEGGAQGTSAAQPSRWRVWIRRLSGPPTSATAKEDSLGEILNMSEFLRGEELVTCNKTIKDGETTAENDDTVTVSEFLKEEKEITDEFCREKKLPPPIQKSVTLADLHESPAKGRSRRRSLLRRHSALSDLSSPAPLAVQYPFGPQPKRIVKQHSAPLLKYLPEPPGLAWDPPEAREEEGTTPPPPSPQEEKRGEKKEEEKKEEEKKEERRGSRRLIKRRESTV
jgi:hypothetical protein